MGAGVRSAVGASLVALVLAASGCALLDQHPNDPRCDQYVNGDLEISNAVLGADVDEPFATRARLIAHGMRTVREESAQATQTIGARMREAAAALPKDPAELLNDQAAWERYSAASGRALDACVADGFDPIVGRQPK